MTLRAEHYGLAAVVLIVGVAIGKDMLKPKNNPGATSDFAGGASRNGRAKSCPCQYGNTSPECCPKSNFGSFSPGFRYMPTMRASKKGDCAGPCYLPCNAPCTKKRNSVV